MSKGRILMCLTKIVKRIIISYRTKNPMNAMKKLKILLTWIILKLFNKMPCKAKKVSSSIFIKKILSHKSTRYY